MSDDNPFDDQPAGGPAVPTNFGYTPDTTEVDGEAPVEPQDGTDAEAGTDAPEGDADGAEVTTTTTGDVTTTTTTTTTTDQVPPAED